MMLNNYSHRNGGFVLYEISQFQSSQSVKFSQFYGVNDRFSHIFITHDPFYTDELHTFSIAVQVKTGGKICGVLYRKGTNLFFWRPLVGLHFQLSASGTQSTFDGFRFNWKTFGAKNSIPPPIVRLLQTDNYV